MPSEYFDSVHKLYNYCFASYKKVDVKLIKKNNASTF